MLSLSTVIDAINKGEIYRFVVKPWLREELLATVKTAVQRYELISNNARLQASTQAMNERVTELNKELERQVAQVLVTFYATLINGTFFGILVAALASITLTMAVNTAFVASSELLERVAHRYGFHWLIVTNRRHSLYRIHLFNALFFSTIIIITSGSQKILADMYAIGLVASFCINMGSLLIYRYFVGTKE